MTATIRDVARHAGVGIGTVSRVLNNNASVSPQTRQRVLEVIAQLDFVPSQIARSFVSGKTRMIAVIAPFFTRPSVVERLRGIEGILTRYGYDLVVFNVETLDRRLACLREVPRRDRYDGVIIISLSPSSDEMTHLISSELPVVLIDAFAHTIPSVIINDMIGGELATQHLLDLGHRQIGFIGDPDKDPLNFNVTSSYNRHMGYINSLKRAGIAVRSRYYRGCQHERAISRQLAYEMLRQSEPPTAIFAASDTHAMGVLEAARDRGLLLPEQLSVIGFDDIVIAEHLGLSTIRQPLMVSGQRGAEILVGLLSGHAPKSLVESLKIELIPRRTTVQYLRS